MCVDIFYLCPGCGQHDRTFETGKIICQQKPCALSQQPEPRELGVAFRLIPRAYLFSYACPNPECYLSKGKEKAVNVSAQRTLTNCVNTDWAQWQPASLVEMGFPTDYELQTQYAKLQEDLYRQMSPEDGHALAGILPFPSANQAPVLAGHVHDPGMPDAQIAGPSRATDQVIPFSQTASTLRATAPVSFPTSRSVLVLRYTCQR